VPKRKNAISRRNVPGSNHPSNRPSDNLSRLLADLTKGTVFESLGNIVATIGGRPSEDLARNLHSEADRNWERSVDRIKGGIIDLVDGANRSPEKLDDRTTPGHRRKTGKGTHYLGIKGEKTP